MSIHEARNTLAGQLRRPLNMRRDLRPLPFFEAAKQCKAFYAALPQTERTACPQASAATFYLYEHAAGMVRARKSMYEDLGELRQVMDQYNETCLPIAVRAYYYLLVICCREMRHNKARTSTVNNYVKTDRAKALAPPGQTQGTMVDALLKLYEKFEDSADMARLSNSWSSADPLLTLGYVADSLVWGFQNGSFGPSYGGPKWGVVAECLRSFVFGETSAAMMLDTVWTLAHNTAPIFNKGMVYGGLDHAGLLEILDVQRSGQIPQWVLNAKGSHGIKYIKPQLRQAAEAFKPLLGGAFGEDIKWSDLAKHGALGSYTHLLSQSELDVLKKKQLEDAAKAAELAKAKAAAEAAKAAMTQAQAFSASPTVTLNPKFTVKKVKVR